MSTDSTSHRPSAYLFVPLILGVYFMLHWQAALEVWNGLELRGPDDFLRLHEAQNWLNGQNWFDITAYRMAPPLGADIHWSRFIDLPIAVLISIFDLFVDYDTALKLASITWPLILYAVTFSALLNLCRLLVPNCNAFVVFFFYAASVANIAETAPGRLDHHNVQMLLFIAALTGMVMRPSWRSDMLIAIAIVVSLSIGLDSAALFLPLLALIGVQWALGYEGLAGRMRRLGLGLAAVAVLVFVTTISSQKWFVAACDAFSFFYLAALLALGGGFVALSLVNDENKWLRLGLGILLGGGAVAVLLLVFPHCANGPYGNLSAELEARWLSKIQEAKGIFEAAQSNPERLLGDLVYVLIMLLLAGWITFKRIITKPEWLVLFAAVLICFVGLFFQIRILRTGIMAALPFCVLAGMYVWQWVERQSISLHAAKIAAFVLICLPLTSYFWFTSGIYLLKEKPEVTEAEDRNALSKKKYCRAAQQFEILKAQSKAVVMSDINTATPILIHTDHTVISGPYHRNGKAILAVTDFFEMNESQAKKIAEDWKVDLVAYCDQGLTKTFPKDAERMDVRIVRNQIPDWLEKVSGDEDQLKVFKLKK